jgi:hypothetical protein
MAPNVHLDLREPLRSTFGVTMAPNVHLDLREPLRSTFWVTMAANVHLTSRDLPRLQLAATDCCGVAVRSAPPAPALGYAVRPAQR